jgi:hypothetical protein
MNDWSVASVELTSGDSLIIRIRAREPAGVDRQALRTRVKLRWGYADQGDGFPSSDDLADLERRESELESPGAVLLMSKTGECRREAVFQVADQQAFLSVVGQTPFEVEDDPSWGFWESTVVSFFPLVIGIVAIQTDLSQAMPELLADLELGTTPGREIAGATALSGHYTGTAVGVVDGWTVALSPGFFVAEGQDRADRLFCDAVHYELVKRSRQALVVGGLFIRALDVIGFAIYRGGLMRRCLLSKHDAAVVDEGDALAEETGDTAEQRALNVLRAHGVDVDAIGRATFRVYGP